MGQSESKPRVLSTFSLEVLYDPQRADNPSKLVGLPHQFIRFLFQQSEEKWKTEERSKDDPTKLLRQQNVVQHKAPDGTVWYVRITPPLKCDFRCDPYQVVTAEHEKASHAFMVCYNWETEEEKRQKKTTLSAAFAWYNQDWQEIAERRSKAAPTRYALLRRLERSQLSMERKNVYLNIIFRMHELPPNSGKVDSIREEDLERYLGHLVSRDPGWCPADTKAGCDHPCVQRITSLMGGPVDSSLDTLRKAVVTDGKKRKERTACTPRRGISSETSLRRRFGAGAVEPVPPR